MIDDFSVLEDQQCGNAADIELGGRLRILVDIQLGDSVATARFGGQLIQHLSPTSALHSAALIGAIAPISVVLCTWYLVSEERRPVNIPELKLAFRSLINAFKTRALWIVACKAVFTREITHCKEPEAAPSTEQLFESLFDAVREVDKMFPLAQDLRSDGIGSARVIYNQTLGKATPTSKDAKLLYTERLSRIDKTFPVTSDKEKSSNTESCAVLKTAAKTLFEKDFPGGKK